jgi:Tfp pilus assembly protein PilO
MQKNQFKIIVIFLCVLSLVLFGSYYFLYKEIELKNEHISTLKSNLSTQDKKQEYILSTQRILQNLKTDIDNVDNSIIAKDEGVKFIENLEELARQDNVNLSIDSLVFEEDPSFASAGVISLKIKAKMNGNWEGIYRLISQFESLPYKIKIDHLTFTNPESQANVLNTGKNWQGSFEIHVLKYK